MPNILRLFRFRQPWELSLLSCHQWLGETTPECAQSLFMALHSAITPDKVQGIICYAVDGTWVGWCKASALRTVPSFLPLSEVLIFRTLVPKVCCIDDSTSCQVRNAKFLLLFQNKALKFFPFCYEKFHMSLSILVKNLSIYS